jgi:hypothetical protein
VALLFGLVKLTPDLFSGYLKDFKDSCFPVRNILAHLSINIAIKSSLAARLKQACQL